MMLLVALDIWNSNRALEEMGHSPSVELESEDTTPSRPHLVRPMNDQDAISLIRTNVNDKDQELTNPRYLWPRLTIFTPSV